jgi:hypothetical protein
LLPGKALSAVPLPLRQLAHRRYLREGLRGAERTGSHVHYWSHLYNLANDQQWPPVHRLLEELAARRSDDRVEIKRLCELTPPDP